MWNFGNTIGTNTDPVFGGIVDVAFLSNKWFIIPNNDSIPSKDDFASREEAIEWLKFQTGE